MTPAQTLSAAIRSPKHGDLALMPYLVAGYPQREGFAEVLRATSEVADVIELGVPFTDPMADGVTLKGGVSVRWILGMLRDAAPLGCPVVMMSYLNPLLAYGLRNLARDAAEVGVNGFIVPDLPYEEGADLEKAGFRKKVYDFYGVKPPKTHGLDDSSDDSVGQARRGSGSRK